MKRALCAALMASLAPAAPALAGEADGTAYPTTDSISSLVPRNAARSILIDAASATLFMIENGRVVDSMKVIVGKPAEPTPVRLSSTGVSVV